MTNGTQGSGPKRPHATIEGKATEIKPDDVAAWNGLATVYNAQRKFDEAASASAKAAELSTSLSATGGPGAGADAHVGG